VPRFGGGLDRARRSDRVALGPGETAELVIVLGQGDDLADAEALAARFAQVDGAAEARRRVEAHWAGLLDTVQVRTPDDSFDTMMNTWLLYQTLSCRIDGRTGYFQPGGAFGFRDQLQDVLALCHAAPAVTRAHLLRAAGRSSSKATSSTGGTSRADGAPARAAPTTCCGFPTRWQACARPATTLLQKTCRSSSRRRRRRRESYQPQVGPETGTMLDHCRRAADRARPRGQHGLPLFGGGDWNDGMNLVGAPARRSTWLGFFLFDVYDRVAWMCERRPHRRRRRYRREAARLTPALEAAWDGEWYRRGYYDDGTTLGSAHNDECRLDSIAQSWAVLSGAVPIRFAERAMDSVRAHLVSRGMRTVALLAPPFNRSAQEPGYIKGYPPGLRENGGQYSHAAAWVIMALAGLGSGDEAMELFHLINPVNRSRTAADVEQPARAASPATSHTPRIPAAAAGRDTGRPAGSIAPVSSSCSGCAAGRHVRDRSVCRRPGPASDRLADGRHHLHIRVSNPRRTGRGVASARVDGRDVDPLRIPVTDDGQAHVVEVVLGGRSAMAAVS
jgi:cyclic beta-1,2-glucan synthetase